MKRYETVAVGGTFDEFHKGHRVLIMKSFEIGRKVFIGLCTDDFVKKLTKPHEVASYNDRKLRLQEFLNDKGLLRRAEVIPLDDPYGLTVTEPNLEALVVSKETEVRAGKINEIRRSKGLPPIDIIVIDMILAENGVNISTTRIRRLEIDHEGHILKKM
jgi:pantetheine-phosphate adenylyltransferase